MIFFSGFSFKNESSFFESILKKDQYTVAGFSYGAIKAFDYALNSRDRIDTLQLLSPAFFQTRTTAFKRMQLRGYQKSSSHYLEAFTRLCFGPYEDKGQLERTKTSYEELRHLLEYEWQPQLLSRLQDKGVNIEVYLGGEDQVIEPAQAKEFFLPHATVYYLNHANHFLKEKSFYE